MATYFLRTKHISRGKGARATRAAAYRAGERIRDERTSEVYDCSDRRDVAYKEVVLPADLAARPDMAWTQDRSVLWNAAEHAAFAATPVSLGSCSSFSLRSLPPPSAPISSAHSRASSPTSTAAPSMSASISHAGR